MMKEYFKLYNEYLKKYGPRTILLMQCGGFYEVYQCETEGCDVKELSRVMNVQYTKRNKSLPLSEQNPYMLGFPLASLRKYKRILTDAGFTVAVYTQSENLKGKIERKPEGIFTFGTNIDEPDNFFESAPTEDYNSIVENNIVSIWCDEDSILHVAALDLTTGKGSVLVNPYTDEHKQFSLIHRFLQIHDSREIIYNCKDPKFKEKILENLDIDESKSTLQEIDNREHTVLAFQEEFLEKVYGKKSVISVIEFLNLEKYPGLATAWVTLIDYAYSHVPKIISNLSIPLFFEEHDHLLLENNAAEQLNLVSSNGLDIGLTSKKFSSVFQVLNNCSTPMGKRFLRKQILQPLNNIQSVKERYEASNYFSGKYTDLENYLDGIMDIEKLQRKLCLSIITSTELLQLYNSYQQIKNMLGNVSFETSFLKNVPNLEVISEMEKIYNFEGFNQEMFFNKGVYTELDDVYAEIEKDKNMLTYLQEFLNSLIQKDEKKETSAVKLENNERDGFYYVVTLKRSYAIKHQIEKLGSKFIEYGINLDKLVFKQQPRSPSVKIHYEHDSFISVKDNLGFLKEVLKKYWIKSCEELTTRFRDKFDEITDWVSRVDFIKSNLKTSTLYRYVCPEIRKARKSFIKVKGLRHPIVERLIKDKEPYIAHNITLGNGKPDGVLLYGLNSAGKSSMMKAVGISIVLAQAGLWVPADDFVFSPYKTLFTRITGNDNIFKGLSSFALEMLEVNNILKRSDENCLVIGDEICRGTETISACTIVSSILIILAKRQSSFIFASHLHDLAQIQDITSLPNLKICNMKIEITAEGKLVYHRELVSGVGETIYGIKIASCLIKDPDFALLANRMQVIHTQLYNQGHKNGGEIQVKLVEGKTSRYNSTKYVSNCEVCGAKASYKGELETHHLIHQEDCDEEGFLKDKPHLKMNSKWNLQVLCAECHDTHHALEHNRNSLIAKWKKSMSLSDVQTKLSKYNVRLSLSYIKKIK